MKARMLNFAVVDLQNKELAITRAGKGQTYIEPTISMWLREKIPSNIVINDPKGGATCFALKRCECVA